MICGQFIFSSQRPFWNFFHGRGLSEKNHFPRKAFPWKGLFNFLPHIIPSDFCSCGWLQGHITSEVSCLTQGPVIDPFSGIKKGPLAQYSCVNWAYQIWSVSHVISKIREVMRPWGNVNLVYMVKGEINKYRTDNIICMQS